MAWVGIINGPCLTVVWFDRSVNKKVYLEKVLKDTVWQNVKLVATKKEYWFQQDGASCHVTAQCLSFLRSNHLSQHATSLATIFARPFTTGLFFLEPMYVICEGESQEHI